MRIITFKQLKSLLTSFVIFISLSALSQPNTTNNRYATAEDAAYWHNVNEGDYIFFKGNVEGGNAIYAGGTVFMVELPIGGKIHIYKGEYYFIHLDGRMCESTKDTPTIVTNLGGQVKWGNYENRNSSNRTLDITRFEHLHLTGKYDPEAQTGHTDFRGHNNGLNYRFGDYYTKYGLWGHIKWSDTRFRNNAGFENNVRIRDFNTVKVSYVAASEGGFSGFNIKTDNPSNPTRVEVDIQDCFSAWNNGEGYYVGYAYNAEIQDFIKLTFRNNIAAFNGTEAVQTVKLANGSLEENNVAIASGSFYRRPFQGGGSQDGLHQFNFVEGTIICRNNIMMGGDLSHTIRFENSGSRDINDATDGNVIEFSNSYYGYSRANVAYFWDGDGITDYVMDGNYYDEIPDTYLVDAFDGSDFYPSFILNDNEQNDIIIKNSTFTDSDREIILSYQPNIAKVTLDNNTRGDSPNVEFVNSGFDSDIDFRKFTYWSAQYNANTEKPGQDIPYKAGDYVFYWDDEGLTRYYRCRIDHEGDFNPNTSPDQWELIEFNGNRLPPLDLRLINGSFYAEKGMGLTYLGAPNMNFSETELDFGSLVIGEEVEPIHYQISGEVLGNVTISAPEEILFSLDEGENFSPAPITLPPTDGIVDRTILIKINPSEVGSFNKAISHQSPNIDALLVTAIAEIQEAPLRSENQQANSEFLVYPNPTSTQLFFKVPSPNTKNYGSSIIKLTDITGKLILEQTIHLDDHYITLPSSVENGTYFFHVTFEDKSYTRQIFVVK